MKALQAGLAATLAVVAVGAVGLTTATSGCTGTAQVRQIFTGLDGVGDRPRDTFYTDTTAIYCNVVFSGADHDETVDVQIVQTTGEAVPFDGTNQLGPVSRLWSAAEAVPTPGLSTVSFTFSPAAADGGGSGAPWAVGHYECRVQVNGASAGKADFDVDYPTPDCPVAGGAIDGTSCAAYKGGEKCPSVANYDPNNPTCRCQSSTEVATPIARLFCCGGVCQ